MKIHRDASILGPRLRQYTDWDMEVTLQWLQEAFNLYPTLQLFTFQHQVEQYKNKFRQEGLIGRCLDGLLEDIVTLEECVPVLSHRKFLCAAIESLTQTHIYPPLAVKAKLERLMSSKANYTKSIQFDRELSLKSSILADGQKLLETYLTWDWSKTAQLFEESIAGRTEIRTPQRSFSSISESDMSPPAYDSEERSLLSPTELRDDAGETESGEIDDEDRQTQEELTLRSRLNSEVPVTMKIKLLVTDILHTDWDKNVRKFFSPIATMLNIQSSFGWYHVALIVGPWLLEWNDSSLCIPRKPVSTLALLTCDIGSGFEIFTPQEMEDKLQKLSRVIAKWNTTMHYAQKPKRANEGNCQDFIEDIFREWNMSLHTVISPGSSLGCYLKKMKENGECSMSLPLNAELISRIQRMSPEICKKYQAECRSYGDITFTDHQELDTFVTELLNQDKNVVNSCYYQLLKSFDRAMWMRHLKYPGNKKFCPLPPSAYKCKTGCPFLHPEDTKSIMLEYHKKT